MNVPFHLQNALTRSGGRRLNGEPNYKFMWSGDFTYLISNGTTYEPFRVVAEDCWLLVKYELPEFWRSQAEWEMNNWEMGAQREVDGLIHIEPLYTAGPYPSQGRYRNIMRIKRQVKMTDGTVYLENCAPTLKWIAEFFPGVRDFLELTTEQKSAYLVEKEKAEKEAFRLSLAKSRQAYKGSASVGEIKAKEEAIDRFLKNPELVKNALKTRRN